MLLLKTGAKLHNILEKCKYNHEKSCVYYDLLTSVCRNKA